LWRWLQAHAVEGIAKAMLPCGTDIVAARYVGTAFTYLFLDDALRARRKVLPESNSCRGLLSCHSNKETREDNDGHSHVLLISPDLHAFVIFEASSGTDAPQPTTAAPPRRVSWTHAGLYRLGSPLRFAGVFCERRTERSVPDSAVGMELQQEWMQAKQCGHHQDPAVTILDVRRMHRDVEQQALGID
jgi:hypothetical protein